MRVQSVAIVYDKFLVQGGGERVCQIIAEAFPDARIFALNARPRSFWEKKMRRPILSPLLGGIFRSRFLVIALYPLAALLMYAVKVKADVVVVYSSSCGIYTRLDCKKSILYSNYPNRGLYEPEKVIRSCFLRNLLAPIIAFVKIFERRQLQKFDKRLSISSASRSAMLKFAGLDSDVLFPPFDERALILPKPSSSKASQDYFLLVSRLEPEKEISYALDAFSASNLRLKVIGEGSLFKAMRFNRPSNIEFLGFVDDETLAREIEGAIALVFPSDIEYSLVPLEAIFLGTPVISYATSSMREILVDVESGASNAGAIFYNEKSISSLNEAILKFESFSWERNAVKEGARRFSRASFVSTFREIVFDQVKM